jgi:hypothetical protein
MAKPSEKTVERVVSAKQLVALLKEAKHAKAETSEVNGALGERVKNAVDNGRLNRKAYHLVKQVALIEDELKREAAIRDFGIYVDLCRKENLFGAEHTGDLDRMARGEDDEHPDPDAENDEAEPVDEDAARVAHASGIKELKPKGRKRGLDGADAEGGTRVIQ